MNKELEICKWNEDHSNLLVKRNVIMELHKKNKVRLVSDGSYDIHKDNFRGTTS